MSPVLGVDGGISSYCCAFMKLEHINMGDDPNIPKYRWLFCEGRVNCAQLASFPDRVGRARGSQSKVRYQRRRARKHGDADATTVTANGEATSDGENS